MKKKFMLLIKIGRIKRGIIGYEIEDDMVLFKQEIFEYKTSIENCMIEKDFFAEFKGKKFGDKKHRQLIKENLLGL